jgi:hypothetical protein
MLKRQEHKRQNNDQYKKENKTQKCVAIKNDYKLHCRLQSLVQSLGYVISPQDHYMKEPT